MVVEQGRLVDAAMLSGVLEQRLDLEANERS
jgi:hypothetical protein